MHQPPQMKLTVAPTAPCDKHPMPNIYSTKPSGTQRTHTYHNQRQRLSCKLSSQSEEAVGADPTRATSQPTRSSCSCRQAAHLPALSACQMNRATARRKFPLNATKILLGTRSIDQSWARPDHGITDKDSRVNCYSA